ncbi:hypothetical protein [Tenacibaculum amylolyticum]|uniref:hypothetical protein n=1 Tax=Tenacibaculum amylolyticum TaxID=104269 RepID=UPI003894B772
MLKEILNVNGVQKLSNSDLKNISGSQKGRTPTKEVYTCWDSSGSFQSCVDLSGGDITCVYTGGIVVDVNADSSNYSHDR